MEGDFNKTPAFLNVRGVVQHGMLLEAGYLIIILEKLSNSVSKYFFSKSYFE